MEVGKRVKQGRSQDFAIGGSDFRKKGAILRKSIRYENQAFRLNSDNSIFKARKATSISKKMSVGLSIGLSVGQSVGLLRDILRKLKRLINGGGFDLDHSFWVR